jgi:two-component system response regulator
MQPLAQAQIAPVVLVAEDDPNDLWLMHLAYQSAGIRNVSLRFMSDGAQTINYILGEHPYADRDECPAPSMLILDPGMPRFDGFQLLEWLHSNRSSITFPVVVFTASMSAEMYQNFRRYDFITAYLFKAERYDHLPSILEQIRTDWDTLQPQRDR